MRTVVQVPFGWSPTCISEADLMSWAEDYAHKRTSDRPENIRDVVDTRGLRCPLPVTMLHAAMIRLVRGEALILLADDPLCRLDVEHHVIGTGSHMRQRVSVDDFEVFLVEKA